MSALQTKMQNEHVSAPSSPDISYGASAIKAVANLTVSVTNAEKAKSAAAEIAVSHNDTKPDPLGDQIKRCNAVAKGESVFKAANAHIFEGLMAAYPLYLMIKDDKVEHQRVIDELMAQGNRERTPSLSKAPYNATVLACHPDNPEEWAHCSDWANVLSRADIENVSLDAFPMWVQDKKIGETKRKMRAVKQANKPLKTPFVEGDFPALAFVFKRRDDERMRQSVKEMLTELDQQVSETLAAMDIVVA